MMLFGNVHNCGEYSMNAFTIYITWSIQGIRTLYGARHEKWGSFCTYVPYSIHA